MVGILINHAEKQVTDDDFDALRRINKALAQVIADRNVVIHGQIMRGDQTGEWFGAVTKGASAGKFHPLTARAVNLVTYNIASLANAAKIIGDTYNWL